MPEFVTVIEPSMSLVPAPVIVSVLPVNAKLELKSNSPENSVVPVPAPWVYRVADNPESAVTFTALLTVMLPRSVVPPTSPSKSTSPVPAVIDKFDPPSTVEANVIVPAPVPVLIVTPPVRVTAPLNVTLSLDVVTLPAVLIVVAVNVTASPELMSPFAPIDMALVVKLTTPVDVVTAPLNVVVPVPADWVNDVAAIDESAVTLFAPLIKIASRSLVPPTAASKLILPVPAVSVRSRELSVFPFTVDKNVIDPAPALVSSATLPVNTTAPLNVMLPLAAVTSPAVIILVADNVAPPPAAMSPPLPMDSALVEIVVEPAVVTPPLRVVVPVPVVWLKDVAAMVESAVTFRALLIASALSAVLAPTAALKSMLPPPATSVKF